LIRKKEEAQRKEDVITLLELCTSLREQYQTPFWSSPNNLAIIDDMIDMMTKTFDLPVGLVKLNFKFRNPFVKITVPPCVLTADGLQLPIVRKKVAIMVLVRLLELRMSPQASTL